MLEVWLPHVRRNPCPDEAHIWEFRLSGIKMQCTQSDPLKENDSLKGASCMTSYRTGHLETIETVFT